MSPPTKGGIAHATTDGPTWWDVVGGSDRAHRGGAGRRIRGTFGPDDLEGTNQMDRIYGLGAKDTLRGRAGNDDCYGGSGADEIRCGNGNDRIDGGFGEDDLFGVGGNDTILAADGQLDVVDCGLGTDTAYVDELDEVAENCEEVFLARPPRRLCRG